MYQQFRKKSLQTVAGMAGGASGCVLSGMRPLLSVCLSLSVTHTHTHTHTHMYTTHRHIHIHTCVVTQVLQLCLTLYDPTDCSLPGSCVHGILQSRILEWVAIFFSRGSSRPRDRTKVWCHTLHHPFLSGVSGTQTCW